MHFSGEKAVFKTGGGKNPNFRGVKRKAEKQKFGAFVSCYCRNRGDTMEMKGIFARFQYQNKQKKERQLCIKVDVLRWIRTPALIQGTIALAGATSGCREGAPLPELTEKPLHFLRVTKNDAPSI